MGDLKTEHNMNPAFFNAVKQIAVKEEISILSEPERLNAFLLDFTDRALRPQRIVFVECLRQGYDQILKDTEEAVRSACKKELAMRLYERKALDRIICEESLEVLAAVLFGGENFAEKENAKKFAVFIDGDNISRRYYDAIVKYVSQIGELTENVRVYGIEDGPSMKSWENSGFPIETVYASHKGKNAADFELSIDTVEFAAGNRDINAFCIASSDAHFTSLAYKLRKKGKYVLGMGEDKSKDSWQYSCDKFELLDNVSELNRIIMDAMRGTSADDSGWIDMQDLNSKIKKDNPYFDCKFYGYNNILALLENEYKDKIIVKKIGTVLVPRYQLKIKEAVEEKQTPGPITVTEITSANKNFDIIFRYALDNTAKRENSYWLTDLGTTIKHKYSGINYRDYSPSGTGGKLVLLLKELYEDKKIIEITSDNRTPQNYSFRLINSAFCPAASIKQITEPKPEVPKNENLDEIIIDALKEAGKNEDGTILTARFFEFIHKKYPNFKTDYLCGIKPERFLIEKCGHLLEVLSNNNNAKCVKAVKGMKI